VDKHNKVVKFIKLLSIPNAEMHTCLNAVIMAILKYSQSAMKLGKADLREIQQPITHAILPKLGYNRHTPRALVYATKQVGGLGMMNWYTEQELSQIKYIIASGIITNPFEDD
jgi:hypothetical protein